ncbi:hypothetical protein RCL1_006233 [Eukaryota sp. TZLM3-RCL]
MPSTPSTSQSSSNKGNKQHKQHWRRPKVTLTDTSLPYPQRTVSLIEDLSKEKVECSICLSKIKQTHTVSSCPNCYNLWHFRCLLDWSHSGSKVTVDEGRVERQFTCPMCNSSFSNRLTTRCFCGKTPQRQISSPSIPHSCNSTCGAFLCSSCSVTCSLKCHPGACMSPPCSCNTPNIPSIKILPAAQSLVSSIPSDQSNLIADLLSIATSQQSFSPLTTTFLGGICRCGKERDASKCQEVNGSLLCRSFCKTKMSCKRHTCRDRCCNSDHICQSICKKELNCKRHFCQFPCHDGPCPECSAFSDELYSCNCKKIANLQLVCGEIPPECSSLCPLPSKCCHSNPHQCHSSSFECPPCRQLTAVVCQCGKSRINSWICSKELPKCGSKCSNYLPCLKHICEAKCCKNESCAPSFPPLHTLSSCSRPCNAQRNDCFHVCKQPCHPEVLCESFECTVVDVFSCECGRIVRKGECRTVEAKRLNCDEICASESKKSLRNFKFAQALGLSSVSTTSLNHSYSTELIKEARYMAEIVQNIEQEFLILFTNSNSIAQRLVQITDNSAKKLVGNYSKFWNFDVEFLNEGVLVKKTRTSIRPILLSTVAFPAIIRRSDLIINENLARNILILRKKNNSTISVANVAPIFPENFHYALCFDSNSALLVFASENSCISAFNHFNSLEIEKSKYFGCIYSERKFQNSNDPESIRIDQILEERSKMTFPQLTEEETIKNP